MATHEEKVAHEKEIYEDIGTKCEELTNKMESNPERFVNFASRTKDTCYDLKTMKGFYEGQYQTVWKGIKVLKTCTTLHIYQHMLQKEKPKTIIELGTWQGGSTAWLSDMCKVLDLHDTKIYSMDLNLDLLHPSLKERKIDNIQFMEGDATKINECFTKELLQSLPHPWLVIDDCHVVCDDVMKYFNDFLNVGDYYIIEDTHPAMQQLTGSGLPGDNSRGLSSDNYGMLANAMKTLDGTYQVDTLYNDFFGYNCTPNMNGTLRKMK